MEFGIFDHVDRNGSPLNQFYEDRVRMTELYDRLNFYAYHIAEHHFTPLGAAASPGILLSSVAQRTKRLRFGPLVYTLPLYHPLRLAEEICMLDHLSNGRFQVGLGRGISPIETAYYGEPADPAISKEVYAETLQILLGALQQKRVTFKGKHRQANDVPIDLEPFQKPYPPLWMGVTTAENAEFAARNNMSFVSLMPPADMRERIRRYREIQTERGAVRGPAPKMGLSFFIVVANTDDAAKEIAARAYKEWHRSFHYLYHLNNRAPVFGERTSDFEVLRAQGRAIAGTPETVRAFLADQIRESGINYVVGQFMFGDMTHAEASGSVALFGKHVMPKLMAAADTLVTA